MRIEEKDYILRLIYGFGQFLRALRDAANDEVRQMLLDARCHAVSGMGLKTVDRLESESLAALLDQEAALSLALLLAARAEVLAKTEEERVTWQRKALRLLLGFREDGEVCRALAETVDQLMRGALDVLAPGDLLECGSFLREGGRIDLMDNAVFFLWETLPDKALWRDKLLGFYEGLSDQTLASCGMDRTDLADSRARLRGA